MKPRIFVCIGVLCPLVVLLSCRNMNDSGQSAKYPLLRSLQGMVNTDDPKELLRIVVAQGPPTRANPREIPPWERLANPLKHEALMRLLELQDIRFPGKALPPDETGTGIDHTVVWAKDRAKDRIAVIGTASWEPIHNDDAGAAYYVLENFEFELTGRLLRRSAYKE